MRTITRMAASLALLATFATAAAAQSSKGNDSVDYAPKEQLLAGTFPFVRSYKLDITSPSSLNDKGDKALAAGITTELRVTVDDFPPASNEAAAAALVTLSDRFMDFHALSETHQTTVGIDVPAGTAVGDYVFTIQAVGPTGIGWGNGGHTLTVTVAERVSEDKTPPAVVITSPTKGQKFTFCSAGTAIPVSISAIDAESPVTSVWANAGVSNFFVPFGEPSTSVVANGSFMAEGIGSYELKAWAQSAGGTSTPAVVNFSVNYAMSWLPPVSLGKVNGTAPIKFSARDCTGAFIADNRVKVEVLENGVSKFVATFGEGNDAVRIDEAQGQYITNFKPAAGIHTYTVKVSFGGFDQAETTFATK